MNKWVKIKIAVFLLAAILAFLEPSEPPTDEVPIFIFPAVAIILFIGSLAFFKGASTNKKLTVGNMASFSKSIFLDPLPFFHFVSIVSMISGVCGIVRDLVSNNTVDPTALFSLAFAVGVFPSIIIANKKFIHEQKPLKKV